MMWGNFIPSEVQVGNLSVVILTYALSSDQSRGTLCTSI